MTYSEAIQHLERLQVFGARFGLEVPRRLADFSGNPEKNLRFIHVAGTNGKGSVCAMLEAIYRQCGLKVGLYTSPHLVSFRERIQVNRQLISEADVIQQTCEVMDLAKQLPNGQPVTFFECVTLMALRYFAEQKCDLVIWETGLGGRLDATNIVTPVASVITNIGHDHQQWLGNTLAEIAFEKAGIIKRSVPVITGVEQPEALAVITETAGRKEAPLIRVRTGDPDAMLPSDWKIGLLGQHQKANALLALATADTLRPQIPVTLDQARRALESVHWPGRFQHHTMPDGRQLILDGAHNPEGIGVLVETLKKTLPGERMTLITGMLNDKDIAPMVQSLAPTFDVIRTVPVSSHRTMNPETLATAFREASPASHTSACRSFLEAWESTTANAPTVIAGSLYLIGESMERLGISASPADNERGLNDWVTR